MKFADIVANALELCDAKIETACFFNDAEDLELYVKRQNKIRNWYFRRIVRGVSREN